MMQRYWVLRAGLTGCFLSCSLQGMLPVVRHAARLGARGLHISAAVTPVQATALRALEEERAMWEKTCAELNASRGKWGSLPFEERMKKQRELDAAHEQYQRACMRVFCCLQADKKSSK